MEPREVYVQTTMGLEGFAHWLREHLNIPNTNVSASLKRQDRHSANYGGDYYLFEILGLEFVLLCNDGEVEIPERKEYPLYLLIRGGDEETDDVIARHIQRVLQCAGIEATVDSLSA